MSTRTYQDAVEHLNSLQANAAALEIVRATGGRSSAFAIPEMIEYLGIIGYTVSIDFEYSTAGSFYSAPRPQRAQCYTYHRNEGEGLH